MNQLKEIAGRIKELREILEMSDKEVADAVGIELDQYIRYENGEDDIPVSILYGIADALGTDTTVLLTGTKEDIEKEVLRCMDIGKKYPGFIMAVGNHIPPNTPVDNALWYNEFYEKYSRR